MENQGEKFTTYGFDKPASFSEAFQLAKEINRRLRTIKMLMSVFGMAPAPVEDKWEIPFTEADVCTMVANLMVDAVSIERLLIHHDLASEDDFLPLYPRWRVSNHRHHVHNWNQFEKYARLVIRAERAGLPIAPSVWKFNEQLAEYCGQNIDNMTEAVDTMAEDRKDDWKEIDRIMGKLRAKRLDKGGKSC